MLRFEVGWFDQDQNTSAAVCARLSTEARMVLSLVGDRMSLLIQVSASVSVAFVLALIVAWRVAIVLISIQPLLIASFYSRSVLMKLMSERSQKAQSEGSQLASEAVINHRTITAFSSQDRICHCLNILVRGRLMNKNLLTSKHLFQVFFLLMSTGNNIADTGSMTSDLARGSSAVASVFAILDRKTEIEPESSQGLKVTKRLRSQIARVSQEPTLFAGSIRDNIIYGKEEATESEIKKAVIRANAHEFVSAMEDGYETYCGERGVQLSGGQRQRIALARAILKNPTILLDEATNALDSVSENLVQEALEKMMISRTSVVVAHRLSTIQKAENIAVIKNGKVVEQGSHSQLLALGKNGSYYGLMKLQSGHSPYR
ncbi:hypothetical protein K7X08_030808 [Anisodus acutangulus]|uniref:Uncharacterized protein n=1 Tax=Anisodus acutangulus TaxID=402998 RepID=A0A9Q1M3P9_9SOLA|nr:hypothetical protein K7X08_030808 [Anisodus acutangulus]